MTPAQAIAALIEKAGATYVQAFITLLALNPFNASTAQAAAIAAIPAALTVISSGIPAIPVGLPFLEDLGLRAARTYVVTFIGFLISVVPFHLDGSVGLAAAAAAATAALAVVKGLIAAKVGNPTAALLPAKLDVAA